MLNNFCLLCIILEKIILLIWSGCHKSSPLDPKMNYLNPVQSCSLKNYINICFSFKSWSHTFRFSCKKFVCISHLIRNLVLKSESQNIIHLHHGDNSNSSSNDGCIHFSNNSNYFHRTGFPIQNLFYKMYMALNRQNAGGANKECFVVGVRFPARGKHNPCLGQ